MTSILIVEDDPHFRSALHRELEGHGFVVHVAATVQEALAVQARSPADIVLTDLRLGGQDGIDLLKRLPTVAGRTRTILMSAYATARDHQIATELGAVTVLVKPFTASELLRTIQKAIDCETGFQGHIHGLSLIDMAQMFHLAQRSVTIRVHRAGATSKIHFQKGQIVHAEHRNLRGAQALRAILATPTGTLSTIALAEGVPQTIDSPFEHLLLQSLSELDEETHAARRRSRRSRPLDPERLDLDLADEADEAPPSGSAAPAEDEPPEAPDDDEPPDAIYSAAVSSTQLSVASVLGTSSPPPSPPPKAPALRPAPSRACKELLLSIDAALVCGIVSLADGALLGAYQLDEFDEAAAAVVGGAARELFCGAALVRLNALDTRSSGALSRHEAQITTPHFYFFAKVLPDEKTAVGLLTRKTINIGMGWALLRAGLAKLDLQGS